MTSIIGNLNNCDSISEFCRKTERILSRVKFTHFRIMMATNKDPNVITNFPNQMIRTYMEKEYYNIDLILRHAIYSTGIVYNSRVVQSIEQSLLYNPENEENKKIFALWENYDISEAVHIIYETPFNFNLLLSLASTEYSDCVEDGPSELECYVKNNFDYINLIGEIISYASIKLFPVRLMGNSIAKKNGITPKQLNILDRLAKSGQNLQGCAHSLNISLDTANKHIAAAKIALGAKTQANAVYLAIAQGLIEIDSFPDEDDRIKPTIKLAVNNVESN